MTREIHNRDYNSTGNNHRQSNAPRKYKLRFLDRRIRGPNIQEDTDRSSGPLGHIFLPASLLCSNIYPRHTLRGCYTLDLDNPL